MNRARPNILLSTTRMWNCGDDFIAFGVQNLIKQIAPNANFIAYNRNPDLHMQRGRHNRLQFRREAQVFDIDLTEYIRKTSWIYDNSWHTRTGLDAISCCVFAGTPEWYGGAVKPLVLQLQSKAIPVVYLGIGGFDGRESLQFDDLPKEDRQVLQHADLITVRDSQAERLLQSVKAIRLPCPALFSADRSQPRTSDKLKIALSCQPDNSTQPSASKGIFKYAMQVFKLLKTRFDCEVICHYVDEIEPLSELGLPVHYSYDARDYFEIYDAFDLVVTTRVHGAGIAASLGIPSYTIKHSSRTETVEGFLSEVVDFSLPAEDLASLIAEVDLSAWSKRLMAHKRKSWAEYQSVLGPILHNCLNLDGSLP